MAHRDGGGDVLRHDVLAQPRPAGLMGFRADTEPLLRAGHRLVGVRPRPVAPRAADLSAALASIAPAAPALFSAALFSAALLGHVGAAVGSGIVDAVVAVEVLLVGHAQLAVRVVVRRGLELFLVERNVQSGPVPRALGQRNQRDMLAEQPALDRRPFRRARVVVVKNRIDLAETGSVSAVYWCADHVAGSSRIDGHAVLPQYR